MKRTVTVYGLCRPYTDVNTRCYHCFHCKQYTLQKGYLTSKLWIPFVWTLIWKIYCVILVTRISSAKPTTGTFLRSNNIKVPLNIIIHRKGAKTDPCGTPKMTRFRSIKSTGNKHPKRDSIASCPRYLGAANVFQVPNSLHYFTVLKAFLTSGYLSCKIYWSIDRLSVW